MRRDQALWDEGSPHGSEPRGDGSSSKDGKNEPWIPGVYRIFAKVFNAKPITLEQEKRFKGLLGRASDEDVALEAIELMFEEGVTYPTGKHLREAIERVQLRHTLAEPSVDAREELGYVGDDYDPAYGYEDAMRWRGPAIGFRDWYATQDADMQARVRCVFPSLKIEPPV